MEWTFIVPLGIEKEDQNEVLTSLKAFTPQKEDLRITTINVTATEKNKRKLSAKIKNLKKTRIPSFRK